MIITFTESIRLWSRHLSVLTAIAAAIAVPVAGVVLILDLVAWQAVDPSADGAVERQLGDTTRAVDETRMVVITVIRYALGAIAYLLIVGAGFRALPAAYPGAEAQSPIGALRSLPRLLRGHWRRALATALVAVGVVVAVRLGLSFAAAGVLAPAADSGALAYLAPINAVHAIGKIVTAPFLAAVLTVVYRGLSARRDPQPRGRGTR